MKHLLLTINTLQLLLISAFFVWTSVEIDNAYLKSMLSIVAIFPIINAVRLLFKGTLFGGITMNDGFSAAFSIVLIALSAATFFVDDISLWTYVIVLPFCVFDLIGYGIKKKLDRGEIKRNADDICQ